MITENGKVISIAEIRKRYGTRQAPVTEDLQKNERNFFAERVAGEFPDGRAKALNRIAKTLRRGPSLPKSLTKRAKPGEADASVQAIKEINSYAADVMEPGNLADAAAEVEISSDATVHEIHKSHESPRSLHPYATREVDVGALSQMVSRNKRMRKIGFPPQSSNAMSGGAIANTGATNDFHDEGDNYPRPNVSTRAMPKELSGSPSISVAVNSFGAMKTSYNAAADAIKQDLTKPKRWGIDQ